jgi:hypothetical protein
VLGTVVGPMSENQITIRTPDGKEKPYEVRSLIRDRMGKLSKGEAIVLLVDEDNKVVDVAVPPVQQGAK